LSAEDGEVAVARTLAMALSEWIELPVGVCLVLAEGAGQEVLRVLPGGDAQVGSVDPARLFPGFTIEHVFAVRAAGTDGSGEETTLHIAADSYELEPAFVQLGEQAAMTLGSALSAARKRIEARRTARELNKLQAYIIQADKLASMGQLAAGVVHELNNPLTSIVAYTEYLIRKGTANPNADQDDLERLRRVGESAGRMLRLTRDLVTYARPSSDIAVPVAVEQVIEKAIAFCEHVVAEVGARVERRFEPELPPVRGMPEELAQVFVNLVTNACHACARGDGVLIVTTSISEQVSPSTTRWIQVTVEDNGHGIEEQNLPHIFAPFFTTKGEGRGTGLGLAIVKNILDKHAGDIHAEAGSQGGTRFVLRFPALEG
jgi:signal transduction histidine kinase